ncbi:MAG: GerW family sporulation protein [Clostridia bacterium]|nr:sporulation protein YtfJ [Oscillospiraceae bacterium]MBQ7959830.1 GerW family sporulation protein [Clostridia bacterium]
MAEQHPVQGLMYTAMQSIRDMIDVNTIVGDPVETPDGTVIIPISKVGLGFGVGGSDHSAGDAPSENQAPFGGGAGGGVSITPVAFMVVGKGQVRLLPVSSNTSVYDRIIDMIPVAIDKLVEGTETLKESFKSKKEEKKKEDTEYASVDADMIVEE